MASTAELTSDGDHTSSNRSATPSPPLPAGRFDHLFAKHRSSKVLIAPVTKDDKPAVVDAGEAAVEKSLGRKRCIMFACAGTSPEKKATPPEKTEEAKDEPEPPKRKSRISFACPMRQNSPKQKPVEITKPKTSPVNTRKPSPAPPSKRRLSTDAGVTTLELPAPSQEVDTTAKSPATPMSPTSFHEFGSSQDETENWVHDSPQHERKLTITDCMKKEMAIRQLGEEAEEEAEEEQREQDEIEQEAEYEDTAHEDDFAPSDDSDDGNESDDEGGFAESDDESDAGSEYGFWAPSATTAPTSADNLSITHFSARNRADSFESNAHSTSPNPSQDGRRFHKRRAMKIARMRPGTPELPDSTDFICGTLDEDRPLEAAYIACREQKKREKHIPIPQDIDPSFPTSDLEDNDEEREDEDSPGVGGPVWLKDQFAEFDQENRGRTKSTLGKSPAPLSPKQDLLAPRPTTIRRPTPRSPPPAKRGMCRSPPPRKLFGNSPRGMRSPAPQHRLRSPPGSPATVNPSNGMPIGLLAQRPLVRQGPAGRTSSLPRTPNPFFRNFNVGSPSISNIASGAVTPAVEEPPKDLHVRGPVDIVMGLEKKRAKRKEKFWRAHCRKAAKEQAEKKPIPGRGAERMAELGLECAERKRGYGVGQQQLVISL